MDTLDLVDFKTEHDFLRILYEKVKERSSVKVLELGVQGGFSTEAILSALNQVEGHLISIDINPCLKAKERIKELNLESRWSFVQTDDLKIVLQDKFDIIFVDTNHYFSHTLDELKKFSKLLKPQGFMLLHDIHFDGINPPDLDVKNAVVQFLKENSNFQFTDLLPKDIYGLGLLERKPA